MKKTITVASALTLSAMLLAGCANPATPRYDEKFGEAVRQARALQTLDPQASRNNDPVTGIDGESGKDAIDRYQDSFKTPPRTFDIFGIGGDLQGQ